MGDPRPGRPRGIMLSHENVIACASSCLSQLGTYGPNATDVMMSYLPMAHMLERLCQVAVMMSGGAIGFYSGDIHNFTEDLKSLRPSIVPAVPRIFNRVYDKVVNKVHTSNFRRTMFNFGLKKKTKELNIGLIRRDTIWDKLLFGSIKNEFGGKVRLMVVGSAPLAGTVLTFIRAVLGCVVVEGYGQTECSGCCSLSVQGDAVPEHVGPPLPCSAIKLVDIPEMEYFSCYGQGEVCIRGTNIFMGYYKDPAQTKQIIDDEGWLHTGDVGQWLNSGVLQIIDRKKATFKLSQGQYVSPQKIEEIYRRSAYISQAFVHGDSLKVSKTEKTRSLNKHSDPQSSIVAVVVPNIDSIQRWAERRSIPSQSFTWLCGNQDVKNLIFGEIRRLSEEANCTYFEIVSF